MSDSVEERPFGVSLRTSVIAVVALALLVYAQTYVTRFGFVNYDDPELVSAANPAIRDGLFAGLRELLDPTRSPQFLNAWLPLYSWSVGLDHALASRLFGDGFGLDAARIYHLHSALLHATGAALVVLIARRLRFSSAAALVAGLLFAAHPAAVESVAWVASRKDTLSFVWMAFAALAYLHTVDRGGWKGHALGAACLLVSMLAKGTTLVLPLLLVVHATLLRERDTPLARRLLAVAPYAVVAVAMTAVHASIAAREGTAFAGGTGGTLGEVLVADLAVVAAWARALAVPLPPFLSVEHGLAPGGVPLPLIVIGALLAAAYLGAIVWSWRGGRRALLAALLALPLALAPFNNLLPRTTVLFAERYAYVPLLPFCLLAARLLVPPGERAGRVGAGVLVALVLAVCAALRVPVWNDSERLWADAAAKAPESALARMQLGQARAEKYAHTVAAARAGGVPAALRTEAARLDGAVREAWTGAFEAARTPLDKGRARAGLAQHLLSYDALGSADETPESTRARLERVVALLEEAETHLREAIDALPAERREKARAGWLADPLSTRATARELLGDTQAAARDWGDVVKLRPDDARARAALGRVYRLLDRANDAVEQLDISRRLAPRDPLLVLDRVKVRLSLGQAKESKDELETATHGEDGAPLEDAQHLPLWIAMGRMELRLQRPKDSAASFRHALAADRQSSAARQGLGAALLEQAQAFALREDLDDARQAAEEARDLLPGEFAPVQILAIVARRAGRIDDATNLLRKAHELFPDGARIREALASLLVEQAAAALDDGARAVAALLMEEAVSLESAVFTTPSRRTEVGFATWPPAPAAGSVGERSRVETLCALARLATDAPESALEHLDHAYDGAPPDGDALGRVALDLRARTLFLLRRPDEALTSARDAARRGPADGEAPWRPAARLASALVEHGIALRGRDDAEGARRDFAEAERQLASATAAGMPESEQRLRLGEIRFAEERFLDAMNAFDRAAQLDPRNVEAFLDLASVWRTQYLLDEDTSYLDGALEDLNKALTVAPGDARVLAGLGETLVMSGRQSEGLPFLMRAILADPSQKGARVLAARLMVQAGRKQLEARDVKEARAAVERALALDPPHPETYIFLGEVCRGEQDWERARVAFEDARRRFPDAKEPRVALAKFYADLGHAYLLTDDRARAVTAFHMALDVKDSDLDPAGPLTRLAGIASKAFGEGVQAREQGDLERSAREFRLSAEADATPETWFALGVVEGERGEHAEAVDAYTSALAARPDYPEALYNRANAYLREGLLDEGERDFRAWLANAPADDARRTDAQREIEWIVRTRKELEKGD